MEQVAVTTNAPTWNPNHWAMFMFLSLSQQAEGWAYMLKDQLKLRQKQVLNTYLNSAKSLFNSWADDHRLFDELIENSVVWSDMMKLMMELPMHKQQALYAAMVEFVNGEIRIEDVDGNLVYTPPTQP
jgi:hypothetical protein